MASRISALNHYRPQIEYNDTAEWREVADFLAAQSTLSRTDIIGVLVGLQQAVTHYAHQGRGVKLEGLGTFLPNINYDGELSMSYRMDAFLKKELNDGSFQGKIRNKKHIGKQVADVLALWNEEHPNDPVE